MHGRRPCLVILTTFYHMYHLLYSATGDVVKVVYNINKLAAKLLSFVGLY